MASIDSSVFWQYVEMGITERLQCTLMSGKSSLIDDKYGDQINSDSLLVVRSVFEKGFWGVVLTQVGFLHYFG